VQTPVWQQPQSQTQQQEFPQQLPAQAGGAWGAAADENNVAIRKTNRYIKNSSENGKLKIQTEKLSEWPARVRSQGAIKSARRNRECVAVEIRGGCQFHTDGKNSAKASQ